MALTPKDIESITNIVDKSNQGLKELFLEKLNGHGETSERHGAQIKELYGFDRQRVSEISAINSNLVRIEGKIDAHAEVSKVEETSRDKREAAVETVIDKTQVKSQFTVTTWVAIALAILGPLVVAVFMKVTK